MSLLDIIDLGRSGADTVLLFGIFWRLGLFKATADGLKEAVKDLGRRVTALESR